MDLDRLERGDRVVMERALDRGDGAERAGGGTLEAVDDVVDRITRVVDAVLQPVPHVALGVPEGVPGAVQCVVDVTGHVVRLVLDLAVLAGGRIAGHGDRATEAFMAVPAAPLGQALEYRPPPWAA